MRVGYNHLMAASRPADPPSARAYTNGEVNRAGALMLSLRKRMQQEGAEPALSTVDESELDRAWEALTWWRSLHARPLSSVATGLRYRAERERGYVSGRIEVTQRLKRLPTIVDKLDREQGQVTQMHDIGGARALLPSLRHVYALSCRLQKTWKIIRTRDYIADPKCSGYRALHLIVERKLQSRCSSAR